MSATVALVVSVHDPDGALWALARPIWSELKMLYSKIYTACSPGTHADVISEMREAGANISFDQEPDKPLLLGKIRLDGIGHALADGQQYMQLCDWDRLIHWHNFYPAELRSVVAEIPDHDFLILGRTARAFASHPLAQRETEICANGAFGAVYGETLDITGGSRGVSARAATALARLSRVADVGVDAEWPLLLRRVGLRVAYRETEGLEYETADRKQAEIAQAGGLAAWLAQIGNTSQEWLFRLEIARTIAEAAHLTAQRTELE